jgi:hypothetical protein
MKHYVLRFHTYSGMLYDIESDDDLAVVRKAAANRIREARKSAQPVQTLIPGSRWEFETPETAFMISDGDGILEITAPLQDDEDDDLDIDDFNAEYEASYAE